MFSSAGVLFVAIDKVNRYLAVGIKCEMQLICTREVNFVKADEAMASLRVLPQWVPCGSLSARRKLQRGGILLERSCH